MTYPFLVHAVQMAVWQRQGESEIIPHSDRGGQFISGTYQKFLGGNALVSSMSAVGHCADNAACEGSWGRPYKTIPNSLRSTLRRNRMSICAYS